MSWKPFDLKPMARKCRVTYKHLGRAWTLRELASHYGVKYSRMAYVVERDRELYVRSEVALVGPPLGDEGEGHGVGEVGAAAEPLADPVL